MSMPLLYPLQTRRPVTLAWLVVLACFAFLPPSVLAQVAQQEDEDSSLLVNAPEQGREESKHLDTDSHAENEHRELRQSFFCRCVANYEDFYELDTGRNRGRSLSTYYNPWAEDETTTRSGTRQQGADSKYYTTEYRQYSARPADDITVGVDGYVIVDGITVLPLSNEACIVSQTNAALRAFLTIFYGPNANRSAQSFWELFQGGGRLLKGTRGEETDNDGDQELPTMSRSGGRKLRFAGWEAKRNKAKRRHSNPSIWEQDLSEGTEYEKREVPRVFPCPPDAPLPESPTPAPTPQGSTEAPAQTPTLSPTFSLMPSIEPSEGSSLEPTMSDPPSLSPLSQVETLPPTNIPSEEPSISVSFVCFMNLFSQ